MPKPITEYTFFKKLTALPFVEAIYLYGSRARGDNDDWSDVDLAISRGSAPKCDWFSIWSILEDADILLKIDCTCLEEITDEDFKNRIMKDKVTLYERNGHITHH